MKKFFLLFAAGSMLAGFSACGPSEEDKKKAEEMLKEMGLDSASMNKAMNEAMEAMDDTGHQHVEGDTSHVH